MIAIGLDLPAGTFREAGRYAFVLEYYLWPVCLMSS